MSATSQPRTIDVSKLPTYAFGHRSLMWWGTAGMIVIEGTVFAGALVTYFYLRGIADSWPPTGLPPDLRFGTINTLILLASLLPNQWTRKAAESEDLRRVRIGMLACIVFGAAFLAVRVFEFAALNTRYDDHAYGSIVFAILALHTAHLLTDFIDTCVLAALMWTGPIEGKRFVDTAENALYWYFVVMSWLPIYAVIYWVPRL